MRLREHPSVDIVQRGEVVRFRQEDAHPDDVIHRRAACGENTWASAYRACSATPGPTSTSVAGRHPPPRRRNDRADADAQGVGPTGAGASAVRPWVRLIPLPFA